MFPETVREIHWTHDRAWTLAYAEARNLTVPLVLFETRQGELSFAFQLGDVWYVHVNTAVVNAATLLS